MPIYQITGLNGKVYQIEGPPGATKEQIKKKILERAPEAGVPPQEENTLEKIPLVGDLLAGAADIPLNVVSGLAGVGKSFTDVFGAGNAASDFLGDVSQGAQDWQSSEARADALASAIDMAQAQGKGTWEELKAAGRSFLRSPLDTTAQVAGSAIPFLAAGVATGGAGTLASVGSMAGLGALSGAGTIKGTIYDTVKKSAMQAGASEEQASAIAEQSQEYGSENLDQIGLGAAIGAAASATGLPRQISAAIAKKAATEVVEEVAQKVAAKSVLAGTAKGALEEAIPEAIQGGQEAYAGNLAANRAGVSDKDPWSGVAGQAALEGISSLVLGGYGGRAETMAENQNAVLDAVQEEVADLPINPNDKQVSDLYTRLVEVRGFPEQVAQRVADRVVAERDALAEQEKLRTARREEATAERTADITPEEVFAEPDINAPMPPEGGVTPAAAEPTPPPIDMEEEAARERAYAPDTGIIPRAEAFTPEAQFAEQLGMAPVAPAAPTAPDNIAARSRTYNARQRTAESVEKDLSIYGNMVSRGQLAPTPLVNSLATRILELQGTPSMDTLNSGALGSVLQQFFTNEAGAISDAALKKASVEPAAPVSRPKFQPSVVDEGRARNILDDPALLKQWQAQGYTEQDLVDITKGEGPTIRFSRRGKDTETPSLFGEMATQVAPGEELKREEFNQFRFAPEEEKARMREEAAQAELDAREQAGARAKELDAQREETLGDIEYALRAQAPENAPYKVVYNPEDVKAPYKLVAERTLGDPNPVQVLTARSLPEFSDAVYGRMMKDLTPFNPAAVGADEAVEDALSAEEVKANEGPERTPYNRMVQDFTAEVDAAREQGLIDNLQRSELLRRFERPNAYRMDKDGKRTIPNDAIAKLEAEFVDARSALTNADVEARPEAQKRFITAQQQLTAAVKNSLINPARAALQTMTETRQDERVGAKIRAESAKVQEALGKKEGVSTAAEQREAREAKIDLKETKVARQARDVLGASPEEQAKVEAAVKGKNGVEALEWLATNGPSRMYRAIASRVLTVAKQMEATGVNIEMNVVGPDDTSITALMDGANGVMIPYDLRTEAGKPGSPRPRRALARPHMAIWVRGTEFEDNIGTTYTTVLHELIHAVTAVAIEHPDLFPPRVRKGVRQLTNLFNQFERHIANRVREINKGGEYASEFEKNLLERINNAADDMHEMLAWALSDTDMQDYLARIPYASIDRSMWQRFTELLAQMFNIPGASESMFAGILQATDNMLSTTTGHMAVAFNAGQIDLNQPMLLSRRAKTEAQKAYTDNEADVSIGLRRAERSNDTNGIASGIEDAVKARSVKPVIDLLKETPEAWGPATLKATLYSIPTSGIIDWFGGEIPALKRIDKLIHNMSNMKVNIAKAADPIAKRLQQFLVNDDKNQLATTQAVFRINELEAGEFASVEEALQKHGVVKAVEDLILKNANDKKLAAQLIADIKALTMEGKSVIQKKGDKTQPSPQLIALTNKLTRDAKDGVVTSGHVEQLAEITRRIRDSYAEWDKLGKMKGGQQLYKEMRQFYKDMFEAELALLDARIEGLFGEDDNGKKMAKRLKDLRADMMRAALTPEERRKNGDIFADIDPDLFGKDYFPFMREGKYWLRVTGDRNGTREKEFYQFDTARERNRAWKAVAERMGVDPEKSGGVLKIGNDIAELQEDLKSEDVMMQQVFDLMGKANATVAERGYANPKDFTELSDAIYQTWLLSTPERSVRRRFMHAEKVTGFQQDLLRQFSNQVTAYSNQLSKMAYAGDVRKEVKGARENVALGEERAASEQAKLNTVISEMEARAEQEINPDPQNALVNMLNRASYFYYLTSAATALVNLTSIPIRVLPRMWRDYGFNRGTAKYIQYMRVWKTLGNTRVVKEKSGLGDELHALMPDLNGSKIVNAKTPRGELLRRARKAGMESNILETVTDTLVQNERETTKKNRKGVSRMVANGATEAANIMSVLFQGTENISRQAAYYMNFELAYDTFLEKNPGKEEEAFEHAVDKAMEATRDTLGDYSNFERPRLAKGNVSRALFLFKMYPIVQTKFMVGAVRDIAKGMAALRPGGDKEARATAAGALTELMGVTMMAGVFGGIAGMPLYSLLAWALADSFDDEDDEDVRKLMGLDPRVAYDSDTMFRKWIMDSLGGQQVGDVNLADIIINGPVSAITNTDLTSRTSLDLKDMWFREAVAGDSTWETIMNTALANVAGGQMVANLVSAGDRFAEGDMNGALKKALPAFARTWVAAAQQGEEGVKDRKGNTIIDRSELKSLDQVRTALGFRSMGLARWQDYYITRAKNEEKITAERNDIFNEFDRMRRDGEMNNVQDLNKFYTEKVLPFNRTYPDPTFVIEIPDLIKSARSRDKVRGMTVSGMRVNKQTGGRDVQMAEQFKP